MNDFINNMGGIARIDYVLAERVAEIILPATGSGYGQVILDQFQSWSRLDKMMSNNGKNKFNIKNTEFGTYADVEINAVIMGELALHQDIMNDVVGKEHVLAIYTNNGYKYLMGGKEQPLICGYKFDTNETAEGKHGGEFTWSGSVYLPIFYLL